MDNKTYFKYAKNELLSLNLLAGTLRSFGRKKIFCIGRNKTGTTSLAKALSDLGYVVGNQKLAELLMFDWARRDFRRLFLYCRTAQAFQDMPFSYPYTFQALDQRFPGSKFILTVRDSAEQWYDSLVRYHKAIFGHGGLPTIRDFENIDYIYKGFLSQIIPLTMNSDLNDIYNRDILIDRYTQHNAAVIEYFRHRPDDLLVLNVAEAGAYDRLCDFLGKSRTGGEFPHENKSVEHEARKTEQALSQDAVVQTTRRGIREKIAPAGSLTDKALSLVKFPARKQRKMLKLIRASGLFDEQWYLAHYPEVRRSGLDPALHYLIRGGFRGVRPGSQLQQQFLSRRLSGCKTGAA